MPRSRPAAPSRRRGSGIHEADPPYFTTRAVRRALGQLDPTLREEPTQRELFGAQPGSSPWTSPPRLPPISPPGFAVVRLQLDSAPPSGPPLPTRTLCAPSAGFPALAKSPSAPPNPPDTATCCFVQLIHPCLFCLQCSVVARRRHSDTAQRVAERRLGARSCLRSGSCLWSHRCSWRAAATHPTAETPVANVTPTFPSSAASTSHSPKAARGEAAPADAGTPLPSAWNGPPDAPLWTGPYFRDLSLVRGKALALDDAHCQLFEIDPRTGQPLSAPVITTPQSGRSYECKYEPQGDALILRGPAHESIVDPPTRRSLCTFWVRPFEAQLRWWNTDTLVFAVETYVGGMRPSPPKQVHAFAKPNAEGSGQRPFRRISNWAPPRMARTIGRQQHRSATRSKHCCPARTRLLWRRAIRRASLGGRAQWRGYATKAGPILCTGEGSQPGYGPQVTGAVPPATVSDDPAADK